LKIGTISIYVFFYREHTLTTDAICIVMSVELN